MKSFLKVTYDKQPVKEVEIVDSWEFGSGEWTSISDRLLRIKPSPKKGRVTVEACRNGKAEFDLTASLEDLKHAISLLEGEASNG